MNILKAFFLFLFILFYNLLSGQIGQYTTGGKEDELILSSEMVDDSSFILASQINKHIHVTNMKFDRSIEWDKTIAFDSNGITQEVPVRIKIIEQNIFVVGKTIFQSDYDYFGFIMTCDLKGNVINKKRIISSLIISDIIKISNSNFGFVGLGDWLGSETSGIVGIVDSNLNVLNKITKVGYSNCWYKRIVLDSTGNIIVIARTNTIGSGFDGLLIENYDINLKLVWQNYLNLDFRELDTYSMERFEHPLALISRSDGSIIIFEAANWVDSDHSSIAQLTIANTGKLTSKKLFNTKYFYETPYDATLLKNGQYAVVGAVNDDSKNSIPTGKSFLILLDSSGKNSVHYFGQEDSISKLLSVRSLDNGVIGFGFSNTDSLPNGLDNLIVITDNLGNIYPNKLKIGISYDQNSNCQLDPEDSLSKEYVIFVTGPLDVTQLSSNRESNQFDLPDGNYTVKIRRIDFNSQWKTCDSIINVNLSSANRTDELNFLVRPINELCNNTLIGISQPDLIKCTPSDYVISIANKNIGTSKPFYIDIKTESDLEFIHSSTRFEKVNEKYRCFIDSIKGGKFKNIIVSYNTSCNVQLGSAHLFQLDIIDTNSCFKTIVPEYRVDALCDGSDVVFQIYNQFKEDRGHQLFYRVYYNQFLFYSSILENSTLNIKPNNQIIEKRFPANGGTWRLELILDSSNPDEVLASGAIESCGMTNFKAHHIGFQNNRNSYDGPTQKSLVLTNSTSKSNSITNSFEGSGYYHLVDKLEKHEYNIRFKSPKIRNSQIIALDIIFSQNYDLNTFVPIQYCCDYSVELSGTNSIIIRFFRGSLNSIPDTSDEFNFKYSISPLYSTLPDDNSNSYFKVIGSYYLDENGPYNLHTSYYNYSVKVNQQIDSNKLYEGNIYELFSNGFNRARSCHSLNEKIYTLCESNSYSDSDQDDLLLNTTTSDLKFKGIRSIQKLDIDSNFYGSKISMSKDLVCLFIKNKEVVLTKYNLEGEIIWSKSYIPGLNNEKALNARLDVDNAGNIYISGNLAVSKRLIFIMAIDSFGNLMFKKSFGNSEYVRSMIFTQSNKLILCTYNFNSFPIYNEPYTYIYDLNKGTWSRFRLNALGNSNEIFDLIEVENNNYLQINEIYIPFVANGSRITPAIAKYDGNGQLIYSRIVKIDSLVNSSFSSGAYNPKDGHYYFVGYLKTPDKNEQQDVLICCTDQEGNVLWWRSYGNLNDESGSFLLIIDEKLIIIAESIEDEPAYRYQPIIIYCDINGNPVSTKNIKDKDHELKVDLMPNPARNVLRAIIDENIKIGSKWCIVNNIGHIVKSGKILTSTMEINISDLFIGSYYLVIPQYNQASIFIKN
ncbi:MAG: hypothetical protein ABIO44_03605 [Saprospiraceae bacterium]